MSTPAPKRLEPFAVPGGLRGTLARLALPDLLRELQAAGATGILSLTSGGARKALYFRGGRVVFASSNLPSDRLGEVLLREGKITTDQNETSVRGLTQGRRQGRVLVEMGALSPDELWWAVQTQVREIVFSVFQWDEGQFHFEESVLPEKEKITVDLDVTGLVLEGVRRMDPAGVVRGRHPDGYLVVERGETPAEGLLHPWEEHVLSRLLDENPGVRLAAVQAAGELRLGSARQLLFQVLEEEDESEVSSAAIWSLSQIGGEDVRIYIQGLLDLAEEDEDVEFLEEVLENLEFTDELNRFDLLSVEPDLDD